VGPQAEVTFLLWSGGDGFKVAGLQGTDIGRMAELAETYLDFRLASPVPPWEPSPSASG
jgi:hypothetical protein